MSRGISRARRLSLPLLVVFVAAGAAPLGAQYNVAAGKPVTAVGTFGVLRPGSEWAPAPAPAAASSIADGAFLAEGTTWTNGTVWWDATVAGSESNALIIDFGATYAITSFTLQADNNDGYWLEWRVGSSGAWNLLGGFNPVGGAGMRTRGPATGFPFTASQVRLSGAGGDSYYSISEFQALR